MKSRVRLSTEEKIKKAEEIIRDSAIKNKEFSECADGIKQYFNEWLTMSRLTVEEFKKIARNNFRIDYKKDMGGAICSLLCNGRVVGEPFIGTSENIKNFETDLFLLLLYISNIIDDADVTNYIQTFVSNRQF